MKRSGAGRAPCLRVERPLAGRPAPFGLTGQCFEEFNQRLHREQHD